MALKPDGERRPLLSRSSTYISERQEPARQDGSSTIPAVRGTALAMSMWALIFILTCNVSALTTIQSPIAEELDVSSEVSWFNSSFLIAVTSLTPISGKLCQIFTPRVYLLGSVLIQALGIALTASATSVHTFLIGRVVCGIGSAAVTPVAFILVAKLVPPKRKGLFFGLVNTGYTTGLACGAILAGALEPRLGWRAVFWLQLPVTIPAISVAFLTIGEHATTIVTDESTRNQSMLKKLGSIDYFGTLALISSLVLLLYTLSSPSVDWRPLCLSAGMLVLFILVEVKWARDPIVPPSVMSSRANIFSGIATVGIMTARWGILFYTPVYATTILEWIPSAAGSLLIPTNLGFGIGGLIIGGLHIRRAGSFYVPMLICFAVFIVVQVAVSQQISAEANVTVYIITLFINGFVVGGLLNYSLAHLLHLTLPSEHVIVIPFNATFRSFSGSFGSAISGGYFLRHLTRNLNSGFDAIGRPHNGELIKKLIGAPRLVQQLSGNEKRVAMEAYQGALKSTFLFGAAIAVAMLIVQAAAGYTAPKESKEDNSTTANGIYRVTSSESATI